MRRGFLAVAGAVAAAGLLSGCGAQILPLVAVRVDGAGAVEVVLRPCGDDLVRGPSLTGVPTGQEESGHSASGWRAPGSRRPVDAEFPLFSPPGEWHVLPVGEQRLLPGHTYQLAFGKDEYNYEYTGVVTFTAADLAALKPGQVRADDRAMSLGEFEELAEDSC
ncbi:MULTISPECIES: hypothetical protein [unclassified Streptomyces]|jgi:hypothetical protein|uniref:hypothetical protein n=1 Tax=unclassified Streptomyces TaxID=2593676 RepID=UPI000F4E81D7|nr:MULTISPECIES: hypothetical protein [unclassified Streptomyces]MDH6453104.1 hypothetical protein [Streptomyces sp. SAI-119]MDH6496337.1 hypothetical protein [Streptomyces sp. SAI-149]QUC56841.1 hypothetical protein IOD14_08545 [Streptomyces sp. A2-16]